MAVDTVISGLTLGASFQDSFKTWGLTWVGGNRLQKVRDPAVAQLNRDRPPGVEG